MSTAPPAFAGYDDFLESAYAAGWSDGFPVAPPEPDRVQAALATLALDADAVVGEAPHRGVRVTAREVALHAALAGCRPEYLPAVVAAVQAFFDDIERRDRAVGGLAEAAQCVILNGPVRRELNVNCGLGVFGPGYRANATIGRALRLLIGSAFGVRRAPVFGDPAQYSFCFGEDEEKSPWTPLQVERGFAPGASTATVHSVLYYPMGMDRKNTQPEPLLDSVVTFLRGKVSGVDWFPGEACSLVLVFGEEYHRQLGAAGWDKAEMRGYLYPRLVADDGTPLHPVPLAAPEDLLLVAAGGMAYAGFWCLVSFGARPSTRAIDPLRR